MHDFSSTDLQRWTASTQINQLVYLCQTLTLFVILNIRTMLSRIPMYRVGSFNIKAFVYIRTLIFSIIHEKQYLACEIQDFLELKYIKPITKHLHQISIYMCSFFWRLLLINNEFISSNHTKYLTGPDFLLDWTVKSGQNKRS